MYKILFFAILVLGCRHSKKQISCNSSLGNYIVEFTILNSENKSIPINKLFSISGKILSATKNRDALKNVSLSVEAIMPEHHHGMNLMPQINYEKDGSFKVDGMLFHMPGLWRILFYIKNGYITESVTYEIIL